MNNWNKGFKGIALFLVLMMAIAIFVGCGQKQGTSSTTETPKVNTGEVKSKGDKGGSEGEAFSFPPKENTKVSIMTPDFNRGRDTLIDKEFENRLNMTFDWTLIPMGDYDQKLSVQLASGDLTDLILLKGGKTIADKYGPQGMFVDLKPYIDGGKMPNYAKWGDIFSELLVDLVDGDGKMYGMENFNTDGQLPVGYLYRKDIFDKMGRPLPETWDEMYEALQQFKSQNPDSTPITVRWGSGNLIPHFYNAYYTSSGLHFNKAEMKYKYGPIEDEERFKKAIAMCTKFYSAGLIDPEFATLSDSQWQERIINGRAIAFIGEYILPLTGNIGENEIVKKGKELVPEFTIDAALPPKNEFGERAGVMVQYAAQPYWVKAINAKSKVDRDLLVALLDYTVSDEAIELANWGIEGQTFTRDANGKKQMDPKYITRSNPKGSVDPLKDGLDGRGLFWVPLDIEKDRDMELREAKFQDMYHKNAEEFSNYQLLVVPQFTDMERDQNSQVTTPLNTFVDEQVLKFVTGELSIDNDWNDFIEKIKGMGWEQIVEIYNKKLDAIPAEQKVLKTRFLR